MALIKCVSFDLWLTLINPNRNSHRARADLLAQAFGVESSEDFSQLVRAVSKELDVRSEETGKDYTCGDRIDLIALKLGKPAFAPAKRKLLVRQCQSSIRENPSLLIDPETERVLIALREKGVKLALVSNTGYPEGSSMRQILKQLGIAHLFDLMLFSNEVGIAKPAPAMYERICDKFGIEPDEILHVGDSRKADYEGARAFGARALLFTPNEQGIEHESVQRINEVARYIDEPEPVARFPLYELTEKDGVVSDRNGLPFCLESYSRFKHGAIDVQKEYGYALADLFVKRFGAQLKRDPESFVIAPFAYMNVPTAAGNMMEWFHERLGAYLCALGLPCMGRIHIHKQVAHHSADHNYAKVSAEERRRILAQTKLSVDRARLAGKTVILIDDILITGSAEDLVYQAVRGAGAREIVFLYVARMDASIALADPGIESRLNQHVINNLDDLLKIFQPDACRMNLRNCKFILESDAVDVSRFVKLLATSVLRELHNTCTANSYYREPCYVGNCACIEAELLRRDCSIVPYRDKEPSEAERATG